MFKSLWIRCNKCGVPYDNPSRTRLYCTSCSHLLCERCHREPCPVCGEPFEKVLIGPNMPPQIKLYFEEMPRLMVLLQKICKFQSEQRNALVARKWVIFDQIYRARQAKAALEKRQKLLREKIRQMLKRISDTKEFIYDCERRKAKRREQERISQYFNRTSTGFQSSAIFNQSGCSAGNIVEAHAAPSPRRLTEIPRTSDFVNRSFSRNDSGHISDFSPGIRTPVQSKQNTPNRIGGQKREGNAVPLLSEWKRRNFMQYGNKPQFTTPHQTFRPPKDPSYRLD